MGTLINFASKINVMTPTFAAKLGISIRATGIGIQNFDGFALKTYGMVIAGFSIQDKTGKIRFLKRLSY